MHNSSYPPACPQVQLIGWYFKVHELQLHLYYIINVKYSRRIRLITVAIHNTHNVFFFNIFILKSFFFLSELQYFIFNFITNLYIKKTFINIRSKCKTRRNLVANLKSSIKESTFIFSYSVVFLVFTILILDPKIYFFNILILVFEKKIESCLNTAKEK
jgi:hypothetical protein